MTRFSRTARGAFLTGVLLVSGCMPRERNAFASGEAGNVKSPADYNIILIIVDCLRADHLSCYGYHRKTSPHIDALAAESARFRQAITQAPNTLLSFTSIFTSRYVSSHRVDALDRALADSALTLAEIFKIYNYKTAAFAGGLLLNPLFRLDQGFDTYYHIDKTSASFKDTFPRAVEWAREKSGKKEKFFLLVHGNDLHTPYSFPASSIYDKGFKVNSKLGSLYGRDAEILPVYKGKLLLRENREALKLSDDDMNHLVARYDEGINYVDGLIGDFIGSLRSANLLDRTIIILTADHGEGLFDHDYFFHDFNLYESTLRVPLLIKIPGMAAKDIAQQVQLIDLMPTMLELSGIEVNKDAQGRSLKPLLSGAEGAAIHKAVFSENYVGGKAMRSDGWKLIWFPERIELYDLKSDPAERTDLAGVKTEIVEAMKKELSSGLAAGKGDDLSWPIMADEEFADRMISANEKQHRMYRKMPRMNEGQGALR